MTSPEPDLTWLAPTVPSTVTSALPVFTISPLAVGTVIVMCRAESPWKKPARRFGATTLRWPLSSVTITSSASRPVMSTVASVVSWAVTRTVPLPFSTYRLIGPVVLKRCSLMVFSRVCSSTGPACCWSLGGA